MTNRGPKDLGFTHINSFTVKAENRLSKVKGQDQGHPVGQVSRLERTDAPPYVLSRSPRGQDS